MNLEPQAKSRPLEPHSMKLYLGRGAILLLLLALAGLSTLAKNGQYFSRATSARHISLSAKMNLANAVPIISRAPLQPVVKFVPSQPVVRASRAAERMSTPATERVCLAVSMQHRSPPLV